MPDSPHDLVLVTKGSRFIRLGWSLAPEEFGNSQIVQFIIKYLPTSGSGNMVSSVKHPLTQSSLSCRLTNLASGITGTWFLKVSSCLSFPFAELRQNDMEGNPAVGEVTVPGNAYSEVINNLKPATTYHFSVVAQNEIGVSGPSEVSVVIIGFKRN